MKNFFKKLSFVLAIAMVLTSIAPATASAKEVVPAKKVNVKLDGEKVTSVELDVEETKTVKVGLVVKKAYAGQKSTYKTWYTVADENVVDVVREGNKTYTLTGVEAGETTITINAAKTLKLAKAGKGVERTVAVVVNAPAVELTAEQTAANQITVTGTDLSETVADYALKLGTASKTLASAKKQADGSVVLTTSASTIAEGVYTLTFGEVSTEVKCAPSKATSIVIEPEVAIMTSTHSAIAYFKVLDQFGTDVTKKSNLNVTGTDITNWSTVTGTVTFDCGATKQYNLNLSQLSLAIADKDNGAFYSNVLTVSEASRLTDATIKGVYKVVGNIATEATIAEGSDTNDLKNHFLLISGVDQYGLPYDAEKMNNEALSIALSSVTGLKIEVPTKGNVKTVEIDDVEYAKIPFSVETSYKDGLKPGEVSLIGYVLTGGKQLKDTLVVGSGVKVDTLNVYANGTIYAEANKEFTLAYEALDAEGNSITDIDTLYRFNATDSFKSSNMRFVGSKDGVAVLKVMITEDSATQTMKTISWMTDTNNYGYTTLTVMPKRFPVSVIGVWTNANDGYPFLAVTANGDAQSVELSELMYEDQYGNVISKYDFARLVKNSGFKVKVAELGAKTDSFETLATEIATLTPVTSANAVVKFDGSATAAAVTSTAKVKLYTEMEVNNTTKIGEYTFYVAAVSMNDVVATPVYFSGDNFYVTAAAVQATPGVLVNYGADSVAAKAGVDYKVVFDTTATLDPVLVGANATGEGKATVVLADKNGTALNIDYTIGNAAPVMTFASVYQSWPFGSFFGTDEQKAEAMHFYSKGFATVSKNTDINFGKYVSSVTQYANAGPADQYAPRVTITNLPKNEDTYVLKNNGTNAGTVQFTEAGYYTLKVTYSWNDGYTYTDTLCFEVK